MTLYPGDLILSGAADVAPVAAGEVLMLEASGTGRLVTRVEISLQPRQVPAHA